MQIVEYFLSIQGEGAFAGRLAIFVRFAGCNFNCLGFQVRKFKNGKTLVGCDTIRAVFTKEFEDEYFNLSKDELLQKILELKKDTKPIIVITGGEPLIHHKNSEFIGFIKALLERNLEVHFETNASIFIDFEKYPFYKKCVFAMGVKLQNSGLDESVRLNFKAIKAIIENAKQSFFKFVLSKEQIENNQAQAEISHILNHAQTQVFCMPLGANQKEIEENALALVQFCIKMGYNYSDRIHIRIWGDKEGV
ncbi:7-carboxy-7-deazaguanine synthase QueE [Campylobacter sp. MIT 99-7217]|uniref:7-carboxy-7-deazaguanine synthase QueE n=1 Tax=Campylobacter sp. MIT 99-7217 TaxID=535091 RepID=UPI00115A7EE5|nr:7-carboxy-7-deazaguanine synthase QueE [Campylobacter sp. MIT 99-7217]TQR30949.1 7-carboxy-7-deazaguanine synthase QueE [Campylobacter sp. MIT 99-7217]